MIFKQLFYFAAYANECKRRWQTFCIFIFAFFVSNEEEKKIDFGLLLSPSVCLLFGRSQTSLSLSSLYLSLKHTQTHSFFLFLSISLSLSLYLSPSKFVCYAGEVSRSMFSMSIVKLTKRFVHKCHSPSRVNLLKLWAIVIFNRILKLKLKN